MTRDSAQPTPASSDTAPALRGGAAIDRAERAFAVGDYRALRRLLPSLQQGEPTRARAASWARSIAVDPVQLAVLAACTLALAAIAIRYGAS